MKLVITGAHFTPAQAVIEKLLEILDTKIAYLGRKYARDDDKARSAESEVLPKLGVKFIPIIAGKLNRFLSLQTIISFLATPIGFIQSFYYLLKEKPDLIVSFGGFTGLPVVVSGWLLSVPSLIHEQGLKMGLANYLSAFFADTVAVSFKDFNVPPFIDEKKIVITGNPIRQEILDENPSPKKEIKSFIEKAKKNKKPLILITAGSQGSHKINLLAEDKYSELTRMAAVIHQTGQSKYDDYSNLKKKESENYLVEKWIDAQTLSYILNYADLAVCRSGINTLMELAIKSVPALMIPIPLGSEQSGNAKYFANLGLGEVIPDAKLTPENFIEKIREMLGKTTSLKKAAGNAKDSIILGAEKRLVLEILLLKNKQDNFLMT